MAKNLDDFDKIIVLDFGSQYNQLITRRIRDFGIYSELLPHDLSMEKIKQINPKESFSQVVLTVFTIMVH